MKTWFKNNKGMVIKLSVILVIAIVLFVLVSIFKTPIANWLNDKYEHATHEWVFWLCIVLAQIAQAVFLQISNSLVTAPLSVIIGICNPQSMWGLDVEFGLKAFLFSWLGITIGNIILYLIGRFAGKKIIQFFIGKDENKLKNVRCFVSSKQFIICASINPVIPSDIVNTLSGDARVSSWFMIPETIISRGICCLTTFCLFFGLTQYLWKFAILVPLIVGMFVWSFFVTRNALDNVNKEKEDAEDEEVNKEIYK